MVSKILYHTPIEWVFNPDGSRPGFALNYITGCLNHTPEGLCFGGLFPCYAYKLANGRLEERYLANTNLAPNAKGGVAKLIVGEKTVVEREGDYADPFYPRLWVDRIERADRELTAAMDPRGIFFNDMSDWLGIGVPESWSNWTLELARRHPRHRIYTLTKQAQNLIKWSPFPDNCWPGATATDTRMALDDCLKLGDIEASVRYLSIEPMLNPINIPPELLKTCKIGWLIIGAQTKPYKPPKIEWVEEIVKAADQAGIPVFLKYNLAPLWDNDLFYPDWAMGRHGFELRQEMPVIERLKE